jgi:hypothetical protein
MTAAELGIELFQSQFLFQMFVYNRALAIDWLELIDLNRPLSVVKELCHAS